MANPVWFCLRPDVGQAAYQWHAPDGSTYGDPIDTHVSVPSYIPYAPVDWRIVSLGPNPTVDGLAAWTVLGGSALTNVYPGLGFNGTAADVVPDGPNADFALRFSYGALTTASAANCEIRCAVAPEVTGQHTVEGWVEHNAPAARSLQLTYGGVNIGGVATIQPNKRTMVRLDFNIASLTASTLGFKWTNSVSGEKYTIKACLVSVGSKALIAMPQNTQQPTIAWDGAVGNSRSTRKAQPLPPDLPVELLGGAASFHRSGGVAMRMLPLSLGVLQTNGSYFLPLMTWGDYTNYVEPFFGVEDAAHFSATGICKHFVDAYIWEGTDQLDTVFSDTVEVDFPLSGQGASVTWAGWAPSVLIAQQDNASPIASPRNGTMSPPSAPVVSFGRYNQDWYDQAFVYPDVRAYKEILALSRPLTTAEAAFLSTTDATWHERMFADPVSAALSKGNPQFTRGDDYSDTLTILDEHGEGMFLPGKTIWLTVKRTVDQDSLDSLALFRAYIVIGPTGAVSGSNGISINGGLDEGALLLSVPGSVSAGWGTGSYVFDIQVSGPEGTKTLLQGSWTVEDDVTRRTTTP